tara:strand:- start:14833 stop:15519 length:687 start_codon:yes stop_codon:yes gene_type:complete
MITCVFPTLLLSQGQTDLTDSRVQDAYTDLVNSVTRAIVKTDIKGSPYFNEKFIDSKIKYFDKNLEEVFYLRYNAFSDEIEMGKNKFQNESVEIVQKNENIVCYIEDDIFLLKSYKNEIGNQKKGYLNMIFDGQKSKIYRSKRKIFMEATQARTSLERAFPARYIDEKSYYISSKNSSEINYLKVSKKSLLKLIDSKEKKVKKFMSENKIKLKNEGDLIKVFQFYESL